MSSFVRVNTLTTRLGFTCFLMVLHMTVKEQQQQVAWLQSDVHKVICQRKLNISEC